MVILSFLEIRNLGTATLHLAWMDGKAEAGGEGGRADSQKPTSQAAEANTADTRAPPPGETVQPVINTPAAQKYSQCSFILAGG